MIKKENGNNRETCHNAWRGLRMTPLFGCFCPSSQSKKCERLYAFIYNNTCVGECLSPFSFFFSSSQKEEPNSFDVVSATFFFSLHRRKVFIPVASSFPFQFFHFSSFLGFHYVPWTFFGSSRSRRSFVVPPLPPVVPPPPPPPPTIKSSTALLHVTPSTTTSTRFEHQRRHDQRLDDETTTTTGTPSGVAYGSGGGGSLQDVETRLVAAHNNDTSGEAGMVDVARLSHFVHNAFSHTGSVAGSSSKHRKKHPPTPRSPLESRKFFKIYKMKKIVGNFGWDGIFFSFCEACRFTFFFLSAARLDFSKVSSIRQGLEKTKKNFFCAVGSSDAESSPSGHHRLVSIYQSTCHRAMGQCQSDPQCRRHLVRLVHFLIHRSFSPSP